MRKRLLAFIIAAAMVFESVPVSASEISHERETVEVSVEETSVDETAIEETTIAETFVKETAIEEPSVKETLTESGAADPAAPDEEKTEERSKEDKTQSVENGQENPEKPETDSTESASEAETIVETEASKESEPMETESQTESETESETETESMSQEPLSEPDYEEYPNAIIPFEIDGTDIFAGLNTSLYTRGIENQAKYDPRVEAPEEMTEVKNQNPWGTCWAFATMACLENAAIRQGFTDNNIDLSERHLAYFANHTGFDKLGNANDDTIVMKPEDEWTEGGNGYMAAVKLMNWHGAASEEKYPYSLYLDYMAVSQSDAQDIEVMAHDFYFIPTKSASKNERVTAIKKLIAEYGCVLWDYAQYSDFYNSDTFAYYNPNTGTNHAITIVGWDDNFSKENFGNSKAATVYKPSSNGAWIVKNSWNDSWGDNGYFYISYEDVSLGSGNPASVMEAADKKEYDNNYFYGNTISISTMSANKAAQVYQVKGGANTEKLKAVSIMLSSDKVKYSLQVYKNPKSSTDPESGTAMLKEAVTGTTGYAGLYTIDLPEPVTFSKGDKMSIVFTFTNSTSIYIDKSGTLTFSNSNDSYTNTNTTHAGQSFRKSGSTWTDANGSKYNFRINAVTVDDIFHVTFLDAYGNQLSEQTVDGGKDAVPPTAPERNGYTFKGWSGSYQNITKDTKLTAEYDPITYSIAYQLNDGTIASENPSSYTIETETIVLTEPVREGYFFAGWYEQSDFSGTPIAGILKGSAGNKTLYAKWEEDTAVLAKPVLIPAGGIVEEGQTVVIKAPKDADIYYTLDGTTPTIKNGIKYTNPFTISKDVTIKAIAVRNGEQSKVAQASCQYYALRLVFAEEEIDLWKLRTKKLEFSQIPATKSEADVTWSTSDNKIVTISEDGTIKAVAVGTATITAKMRNGKGSEVTASCRVTVKEADDIASGSYKKIVWYIDSDGQLVVMGSGEFSSDHYYNNRAPWYEYREKILSAEINVTGITNTAFMFNACSNLKKANVRGLKTDQVTDMRGMFNGCSNLTEVDVSGFKTDKVINMYSMFSRCSSLTNLDVSGFKTDQVTDMRYMFYGCSSLTNLDVSGFQTGQVTAMNYMFSGCNKLTELNLSSFDLSNAGETVTTMFPTISNLKTIYTPRNLKQSISLTAKTNYTWRKPDGTIITELPQNSSQSILITQKFSTIEGNYQNIKWKIDENEKLTVTGTGEISADTNYDRAPWYQYRSSIQSAEIKVTGMKNATGLFYGCSNLKEVDLSGFQTNQVTNMFCMFYNCKSLTKVDVSGFKTDQVTVMSYLFYNCSSLTKVDVSGFQTNQVYDVRYMFYGCNALTDLNLSSFDLSRVTAAGNMFPSDMSNLQTIRTPRNLKQSVPLTAKEKYVWCKQDRTVVTELPQNLSESILIMQKWEAGGNYQNIVWEIDEDGKLTVTGTGEFSATTGYDRAPWYQYHEQILSAEIKVSDIINTSFMFYNCSNLKEIDVSGFQTDKVTHMNGMFNSCKSLTNLDVSGFQTDKVITMSSMFSSCNNLTNLDVSGFQTAQVTSMGSMFSNCSSLTAVDVSGFQTDQVTDMSYMFYGCKNLTAVDVSGFQTDQVTHIRYMFYECNELTDLDLSGFDLSKVTLANNMLPGGDTSNLQTIHTPRNLNQSVPLTAKEKYVWCEPDWTVFTELPQNRSESILLTQKLETGGKYQNIIWEIDENGKLTVTGTGEFSASTDYNRAPWYNHREDIRSAQIQVTGLQNAAYMFSDCSNLTKVDLSSFDTDQVTNMCSMFNSCSSLTALDISGFNTTQVTNMESMFYGCNRLAALDISSFETGQVTNIDSMFDGCDALTDLNISSFDLGSVDGIVLNMLPDSDNSNLQTIRTPRNLKQSISLPDKTNYIWCKEDGTVITELPQNLSESILITQKWSVGGTYQDITWEIDKDGKLTVTGTGEFSASTDYNRAPWHDYSDLILSAEIKVTGIQNVAYMLKNCSNLTKVDLSGFKTDKVTDMSSMFEGCSSLTEVDLSGFQTEQVTNISLIFNGCNALTALDLSSFDLGNVTEPIDNMLPNSPNLQTIHTPRNLKGSIGLPTEEGKVWYQEDGTEIVQLPQNLDHSILITKKDKQEETIYKVTFDLKGHGTKIEEIEVKKGEKIIEPSKPEAKGYNFTGWYKDTDCKTLWNFESDTVEADTTLYAGWEQIKTDPVEKVYKVTFDLKGHGTKIEEIEVKSGEKITEPPKPQAEGYTFMGWYKDAACVTLWNFEKDTVKKKTTLYAGWRKTSEAENPYEPPEDMPDGFWIAPIEDCTYTGMAITPAVHVYYNKQKLIAGRDYTLTYRNNTKAASALEQKAPQVCVKGKGNYSGTAKRSFTIAKAQLTEENLKAAAIYGANIKYTPLVALDGNVLKEKTDYTLLYLDANGGMLIKKQPTTIGSYQMRIIGKGSCEGQIDFSYSIAANGGANAIDKGTATVGDMIYDGIEPHVTLIVGGRTLERNTDYMVNFINTNKKGTATAVFFGIGNYAGTLKKKFKVQAAPIRMENIQMEQKVMYEKGGAKPNPTITVNGTELVAGKDYKITYKNNTKIGYAEFTVKGTGNYTGNLTGAFQVEPKILTTESVKIYVSDAAYGKNPAVMVYDSNGKKLSANSDYTVFIDNTAHNVFITAGKNGLYKTQEPITIQYRELEKDRLVNSVKLNKKVVGFPKYFEYTGSEVTLEKDWLTVKAGKTVLQNDAFEIVSYVNNIEKGTATVIIQGKEGYGGIKVLNFKIKAKGLF